MEIIKSIWRYFFPQKEQCLVCGKTDMVDPVIFQARDLEGNIKYEFKACFECAVEPEETYIESDE